MNKKVINLEDYKNSEAGTYLTINNESSPSLAKKWIEDQDSIWKDDLIENPYGTFEEYVNAEDKLVPLLDKLQGDKKELMKFVHYAQSMAHEIVVQGGVIEELAEDLEDSEDK